MATLPRFAVNWLSGVTPNLHDGVLRPSDNIIARTRNGRAPLQPG